MVDIEASFFYPNKERFFRDVSEVLKKDGTFLYGVFMHKRQYSQIETWLNRYFDIEKKEDISEDGIRALKYGSGKTNEWIESDFPFCKYFMLYF